MEEATEENMDPLEKSILKKAKMARAQADFNLRADIREMINDQKYSDVAFLCKDGERVHASRLFLVARSSYFRSILPIGMIGSQISEITLHNISSTQLLPVMEFLYTGMLEQHTPKTCETAYDILDAAKCFLLEDLKPIVVGYLPRLAPTKVGADIGAAQFLSRTMEFAGDLGEAVEPIACESLRILKTTWWKLEHLQALTGEAFRYFLQKTKKDDVEPKSESHEEFNRLKSIVLWCACKEFATKGSLALDALPLEVEYTHELLQRVPMPLVSAYTMTHHLEVYNKIRSQLVCSVQQYLPLVNLRRIPLEFLIHLLKPMSIISSSALVDAKRFHMLENFHVIGGDFVGWSTAFKNREVYKVHDRVIKQMTPFVGLARFSLTYLRGMYEWEIVIKQACVGFIEIGLHHDLIDAFNLQDGCSLSGQPGGWALHMDPQGVAINRTGNHEYHRGDPNFAPYGKNCSQLVYGKHYAHKNCIVKVRLDVSRQTCSFVVDNEDLGVAWACLPDGCFFPALSLGSGSGGCVELKDLQAPEAYEGCFQSYSNDSVWTCGSKLYSK